MTGSGTLADPYIIYDVDDLQAIENDLAAYYELANDIDASATSGWNAGQGFLPLGGVVTTAFTGSLDGKGYSVDALFMDNPGSTSLFYENSGTITRLGLTNCDITGARAVSPFASTNKGTISKCFATGSVVNDTLHYAGGFVSSNEGDGVIENCYSRCSVTGNGSSLIAGFVRYNSATITNCYSTGLVSNGGQEAGFCHYNGGTITNCFWDTETSGQAASDGGTGKTTAEMKTESTFTDAGWDFTTIWYINPTINDGYPAIGVVTRIKGNIHIDQRMFQHVERMD